MLFKKVISRPGRFHVSQADGSRREEVITPERIAGWVRNTQTLMARGVRIPAPFAHMDGDVPVGVVASGNGSLKDGLTGKPIGWRADLNGGFWKSFEVGPDGELIGVVEVPGDPKNLDTPAGKVSNTIRETSVFVAKDLQPGTGEKVEGESLLHVALVTNPVEPGQANFEPFGMGLMFSMPPAGDKKQKPAGGGSTNTTDGSEDGGGTKNTDPQTAPGTLTVSDAIAALLTVGLVIPDDTTETNLVERIVLVARQKAADKSESDDDGQSQEPQKPKPQPIAMSNQPNPKPAPSNEAVMLMSLTTRSHKSLLHQRAEKVKHLLPEATFKSLILDKIEAFSMSIEMLDKDGNVTPSAIDEVLGVLEAVSNHVASVASKAGDKSLLMSILPSGSATIAQPRFATEEEGLSEKDEEALLAQL